MYPLICNRGTNTRCLSQRAPMATKWLSHEATRKATMCFSHQLVITRRYITTNTATEVAERPSTLWCVSSRFDCYWIDAYLHNSFTGDEIIETATTNNRSFKTDWTAVDRFNVPRIQICSCRAYGDWLPLMVSFRGIRDVFGFLFAAFS